MASHLNIYLCCNLTKGGIFFSFFVVNASLTVPRIDLSLRPTRVFTECCKIVAFKGRSQQKRKGINCSLHFLLQLGVADLLSKHVFKFAFFCLCLRDVSISE